VELLDKPEEQTAPIRIGRFVLYGGGLNLNGMYLRHVTLTIVHVYYSGEKYALDDVVFSNCAFTMDNLPRPAY